MCPLVNIIAPAPPRHRRPVRHHGAGQRPAVGWGASLLGPPEPYGFYFPSQLKAGQKQRWKHPEQLSLPPEAENLWMIARTQTWKHGLINLTPPPPTTGYRTEPRAMDNTGEEVSLCQWDVVFKGGA